MLSKKYFLINNKLVPFISGSSEDSLGSTISVQFSGELSYSPDTSRSTDIHFVQIALGEGPIYRINPNGPQDIEIDDKFIDDLVDFNTNNTRSELFKAVYRTGTVTQTPMPDFFSTSIHPVRFPSAVVLKSGISESEEEAPPASSVEFFPTTASQGYSPINSIVFKYNVTSLSSQDSLGTFATDLSLVHLVHDRNETSNVENFIAGGGSIVTSLVDDGMLIDAEIKIPEEHKSANGYSITSSKISADIAEEGYTSEVEILGFDEIRSTSFAYPRTALAGYAVKSSDFRTGSIPNYTSLLKGLIVDVPSNYNQPILENGEVDWRQIEVPPTGAYSAQVAGFRLQNSGKDLLNLSTINIYQGLWDGTYKKDWTENAAWIIKYLITEGLGLPEKVINKYNFYKVAQYYDAVDPSTGNFQGVKGFSDGSFRYKPNGYFTEVENALLGLDQGTEIRERRFVTGISITDKTQVLDLITAIAASCRTVVATYGNKVSLIVDQENILPSAYFNETNIQANSFKLSGVSADDHITGVDVSFIDFINHFERTSVALDIDTGTTVIKENRLSIDATGTTRRSQALRLASYHLETKSNNRRKVQFSCFSDGSDLEIGDVISVSQKIVGVNYGFGGRIFSDSSAGSSNVALEHVTSPTISENFFTSNTNPIMLKVFMSETNDFDYYTISGDYYDLVNTGNTVSGVDTIFVSISERLNKITKTFESNTAFSSSSAPQRGDLWALGEVDIDNLYSTGSDKLFRIDTIEYEDEGITKIVATEYNSDVLAISDNAAIASTQVQSKESLQYKTPPVPNLALKSIPAKTSEGIVYYNAKISSSVNSSDYTIPITTSVTYGYLPNGVIDVFEQE